MKKGLMIAVAISALGLAGCVAVPYNAPYGGGYGGGYGAQVYGPQVYVAPPALVIRPAFYGGGYYAGPYRRRYY